jgi:SAM-dependent methyltransferase
VKEANQKSLEPAYFDELYSHTDDPWGFATREYEARKYAGTIAALPRRRYSSAFEIGCSIGVLTRMLAERCAALLAVDVAERALEQARQRCADLEHVRFACMQVPDEFPMEVFDLVVVSEVGYYWSYADLDRTMALIWEHLRPHGHLLMVHWTPYVEDYPLRGDEVHEHVFGAWAGRFAGLSGSVEPNYRLDLFERAGP